MTVPIGAPLSRVVDDALRQLETAILGYCDLAASRDLDPLAFLARMRTVAERIRALRNDVARRCEAAEEQSRESGSTPGLSADETRLVRSLLADAIRHAGDYEGARHTDGRLIDADLCAALRRKLNASVARRAEGASVVGEAERHANEGGAA